MSVNPTGEFVQEPLMGDDVQVVTSSGEARSAPLPTKGGRFDYGREYRDKPWLAGFLLQLLIMIILTAAFGSKASSIFQGGSGDSSHSSWTRVLLPMVIVCAVVAIGFSFVWIYLMKRWAGTIIPASFFIMAGALVLNGIIAASSGVNGYAAWCFILAALVLIYLYVNRRYIPFTKAVMTASAQSLNDYPASIWLTYLFSILQVGWFCLWVFGCIAIIVGTESLTGVAVFFFFLSFYWTSQVISNISHTTTAGMVASWWLQVGVPSPTLNAFRRATTTSLGSIAFGSLIVALVKALSSTIRVLCSCGCYKCCAPYFERIIKYFNMYALSYVAIYGQPFYESAKATADLFQARGFTAIINDSFVGVVLYVGSLVGGAVAALVGLAWVKGEASKDVGFWTPDLADPNYGTWIQVLYVWCAFLAGFFMTALSMTVFSSAVATTFVVWAEDAGVLSRNRPSHYKALQDGAAAMYGAQAPQVFASPVVANPAGISGYPPQQATYPPQAAYPPPPAGSVAYAHPVSPPAGGGYGQPGYYPQ